MWRRKALSVLSVPLNWEIKILSSRFTRSILLQWAPPAGCHDALMPCANEKPHPQVCCHWRLLSTSLFSDTIWSLTYPDCRCRPTKVVVFWIKIGALASGKCKVIWNVSCIWDQMLWCKMLAIHKPAVHNKTQMMAQVIVVLEHVDYDHSICNSFGLNFV